MLQPQLVRNRQKRDRIFGAVVWAAVGLACAMTIGNAAAKIGGADKRLSLANYWLGRDRILQRSAERGLVAAGDPVFYQQPDGSWVQLGYAETVVASVDTRSSSDRAADDVVVKLRWHDQRIDPEACRLVAYQNRGTVAEMVQVMFPRKKREAVRALLADAMQQHGELIANRFLPLVERSIRESLPIVETELLASLDRHHDLVSQLGERWKEELLRERLLPLAREQLLPIARHHAEPTIREIGRELWSRASLWSFTWRAAYDKTPLPRKNLTREEWERFIREEAMPVIQSHSDDIATAIQRSLADMIRSQVVRDELAATASLIVNAPEMRELVGALLRETLVENEAVRKVWVEVWTSDEADSAYAFASDLLGPLVHRIGEEMLGSPQRGIDPGLARLLRHQILGKDRRWIVATEISSETPRTDLTGISRGSGDPVYPMLYLAAESLGE
jgi:hypothetical protein